MAKYEPIVCTYLPELFRQGASIEQVCAMLQISRRAWYDWCEKYPEFDEAAEQGKAIARAWWEHEAVEAAFCRRKVNTPVFLLCLKNRIGWSEKAQLSGDPEAPPVREITRTIIDPEALREVRAAMLAEDNC
tara:strand:+ start:97 stop:492 length:396 start_codon:yes stop_codon:yes gene_type:complete